MNRASRMMFWSAILILQVALIVLSLAGCTREPPTSVCLSSHEELSTYQVPIQVGCSLYSNGVCMVPIYTYIDEEETTDVCDKSRPITADELAAWHKAND